MRKELGKIQKAEFGFGGYQDAMLGLTLTLGGEGWGVGDFVAFTGNDPHERGLHRLKKILTDAKKMHVHQLAGTPIEVSFEGNILREWRVLTEVL